jgi:CRISPR-associated protein Csh1
MINNFREIGKVVLNRSDYYNTNQEIERRKIFLLHQSLVPFKKKKGIERAISLNFNLDKGEFYFELDKELDVQYRDYYFAFKVGSSNDQKKFLSTNNMQSFITKTFSDSIKYLDDRRQKKASGTWLKTNISTTYDDFLIRVKDKFYRVEIQQGKKKEETSFILDEKYLAAGQKDIFLQVKQDMEDKRKDKTKALDPGKIYLEFLKKKYLGGESTELPSLFLVKFNGRHIMEMEEHRESYINLAYYDLLERFFMEDAIDSKMCHVCREVKEVIGDIIPLSMKFYGTTNELFFENLKNKNAYKSFAVCQECLAEVLTGMRYVENHLRDSIFGLDCFLIPDLDDATDEFEEQLKGAVRLIQTRDTWYKEHIDHLREIMRKSARTREGFSFNMMFYTSSQNDFDIHKYISNLELKPLLQKMQRFDDLTEKYQLYQVGQYDNSLRLTDIRYYLFPSKSSHGKADFNLYGKDLLNFLENFLHENKIGYHDLIHKFTDIFRRRFNRGSINNLSPFKMVLFMTILNQIDILKEDKPMNMGHSISEIVKQEYREFFQTHQRVYEGNHYRQGLFLLGTIISRIVYAQKGKKATFMKKINLAGIPAHRVKNLIGEVKEYASIYTIFEDPGIWGNIMDRLQGIEESGMKGDEIVFYILTGISYEDYLGMKYGKEKKLNQGAKGERIKEKENE